tara:strand:- start:5301 stop:5678 length:378 start_codon:yes stop_codon:yes gene_type:complete
MSRYIDGFVHAIHRDRLEDYKRLVVAVAEVWKEHGALDYWECVGDDLHLEGTRSYIDIIEAKEDEVILFGWVVFASREKRDLANKKVAADPRMEQLMAASNIQFDAQRMAYGGFQTFISSPNVNA